MRKEIDIIQAIIEQPDKTSTELYNMASFDRPNIDKQQSATTLLAIDLLRKMDKGFLKEVLEVSNHQ